MDRQSSHGGESEVERFARLTRLFDEARLLDAQGRQAFLRRVGADDEGLARELELLLGQHDDETGVLGTGRESADPALVQNIVQEVVEEELAREAAMPESIGPYRPERILGRGGMGTVFLAHRTGGDFEKRVAIKILRSDIHDEDLARRFRAERSILAGMEHPNIAAVLDGGTLPGGRPYVVMEYVDGTDLVSHARQRGLSVRERCELFRKVCDAVAHAHRNLVVHRDLKPSNILVGREGEPKLVDFGIAKLLDPARASHSLAVTGTGLMLLTPEYAAPEQVRGEPITTGTDVYALGAVLYELLSGERAHPLSNLRPTELERVICEETPTAPSTAVARAAAGRARLVRELAGDLDNIVLMAMRKEPHRRYGAAAELSDDLGRHLAGLPVRARKDTWRYRTSKFVRRNVGWVAAGGLVTLLVSGFAIAMAVQAGRLARQRNIAQREFAVARDVSEFLVDLFQTASPDEALGREVRARELLDLGSQRIAHELETAPEVRASLMDVMGRAYHSLGLYGEASPLLEDALALRSAARSTGEQGPPDPGARAQSLLHLGNLRYSRGAYEEAEALLRAALEAHVEAHPEDELAASQPQLSLAVLLRDMGRTDEALELAERGLRARLTRLTAPDARIADALSVVARVHQGRGEFDAAERLFLESRDMRTELFAGMHPDCAQSERELGSLYSETGRYPEGIAAHERALEIDLGIVGEGHPDVSTDYFGLASLVDNSGDLERAEQLYRKSLELDRSRLGRHPFVALNLNNLASVCSRRGRFDEAEAAFGEALEIQREFLPPDHPEIATTLSNLGTNCNRRGEPERGVPYVREALAIREKHFPPDHPTLLTTHNILAVLAYQLGDYEEAEYVFRRILEIRRRVQGDHPYVAGSLFSVATAVHKRGDLDEAEALLRESVDLYRRTVSPGSLQTARPLFLLGGVLLELGRPEEAEPILREAYESRRRLLDPAHRDTVAAQNLLARCVAELEGSGD